MTPTVLLEAMKAYIQEKTKDILLPVRSKRGEEAGDRPPNVFLMNLPKKKDEIQQIPYILIKYLTGKDEKTPGEETEAQASIRIIVATYAEDAEEGSMALLNVISNLRYNFLKDEELNQQFRLVPPLESIIYPDDTRPYYLGEMMTIWTLPPVEREVNFNGY